MTTRWTFAVAALAVLLCAPGRGFAQAPGEDSVDFAFLQVPDEDDDDDKADAAAEAAEREDDA